MHISITGLKPKWILGVIRFWRYAIPSFSQVKNADGILYCEVRKIKEYHCTLTAWESKEHMRAYLKSGVHLKAMKQFHKIATGKTYGYESEAIPSWEKAYELLQAKGKEH